LLDGFRKLCEDIIKDSLEYYEGEAHQYTPAVYEKTKEELESAIHKDLLLCFDSQLKLIQA